ncbi:MAG: GNAT family N-acetyltransferase [Selenomonadaceae bacterium]|nr:GNAT family N-acetyltransferase [Selenomonadaceae bacterium]
MSKVYISIGDYAIREIEESDLSQLLEWRNSPEIHSKMLTDHIITWDEHLAWFKKIKEQDPTLNFAFVYQDKLVGYAGYTKYDPVTKTGDGGSYLAPELDLPVDAGIYSGELLLYYGFETLGIKKTVTDVFLDNERVVKMNKLMGSKIISSHKLKKGGKVKEVVTMELTYEDWRKSFYREFFL